MKSVQELIAYAKANPAKLNFGSGGAGSPAHLAGEMFKTLTGVNMTHVPYKGTVLSVNDLIAGQVQLVFSDAPPAMPHVKSGKLRALAVTGAKRTPLMPELPTVAEGGVAGFALDNWWGILVPAGTPKPVINRINAELVKALQTADVKERFANLGVEAIHSTPAAFDDYIKAEIAKLAKIIKASGARADWRIGVSRRSAALARDVMGDDFEHARAAVGFDFGAHDRDGFAGVHDARLDRQRLAAAGADVPGGDVRQHHVGGRGDAGGARGDADGDAALHVADAVAQMRADGEARARAVFACAPARRPRNAAGTTRARPLWPGRGCTP